MKTYSISSFNVKNSLIVFFCLTVFHFSVQAQRQVIGRVLDKDTKNPIKAATVTIHGTDSSTVTNAVGYFQIAVDTANYLVISSPGYESGLVKIPKVDQFQLCLTKHEIAPNPRDLEDFYKYISRNLRYPDPARWSKIQGRVYVSFETDSLGKMQNIALVQDIGGACGKEVYRVLKACPKRSVSLPSNSSFLLPVTFKIHGFKQESAEKEIDLPVGKLLEEVVVVAYM